ncbi:hypothetical protein C474_19994 [Halogeometricum pallidum JCM 14848]|uniref:DUF7409 domain-containing protein n=1 Tax=Halogeometricum pallidum JCM 14848 TaxID=1227487 RepID=M0CT78_HALPD|nr:helix-hairpin-helix domain-containing protein [Halogeometricum pallidum]ELZ26465.1 hypothetical protein C474_19994 [Halogeometricum pallidum JCM 14848]
MNQGADSGREGDDAAGGSDGVEDRTMGTGDAAEDAEIDGPEEDADAVDEGGEGTIAEGDPESWSAAAPTDGDGEVPLPWTVVDEEEFEETFPEALEELRFVGPKTAAALRDSPIDAADVARKRVSYRDLTAHGVHPGVAAKIRREHSLSWSFDAEDGDLSRRSSQVRGLDDDERAWVAASSEWAADEASAAESAWQTRADGVEGDGDGTPASTTAEEGTGSTADAEAEWRAAAEETASDGPTRDEEAAWRAKSTPDGGRGDETDEEAAWRERATESEAAARDDGTEWFSDDAEAAWREQSAPTPVTALDAVGDDHAARLADAGIRSVRRLATADPASVADALELGERRIRRWCEAARAHFD